MDNQKDKDHTKNRGRKTYSLDTVPKRVLEGIRNAKVDPKYNYLNDLLNESNDIKDKH